MKSIQRVLLKLTIPLSLCGISMAETFPFLHPLFTNNMIVQRGQPVPIWGWTTPNTRVSGSINNELLSVTSDANGFWQMSAKALPVLPIGQSYTLTITGPQSKTITGILSGDVFLCSGQSNMATSTSGYANLAAEKTDAVNYGHIHAFTVNDDASKTENQSFSNIANGGWQIASPANIENFSATAYYFAKQLSWRLSRYNPNEKVPIGIVVSAVGATRIESWMSRATLSTREDGKKRLFDDGDKPVSKDNASQLYNSKINPLRLCRFKGVLWYQGEGNSDSIGESLYQRSEQYQELLPLFIGNWRNLFNNTNLPFIIVQIAAPTNSRSPSALDSSPRFSDSKWAKLRAAQEKVVLTTPKTALVTTLDIAQSSTTGSDIHPYNKQDVGKRASIAALNLFYGWAVPFQGPICTNTTPTGNKIVCTFSNTGDGLTVGVAPKPSQALTRIQPVGGTLKGFVIAGQDGTFKEATAIITSPTTVEVSNPSIATPKWVRYAWADYPECNLYAKILDVGATDALAAGSFRNDPYDCLYVMDGNSSGYAEYNGIKSINAPVSADKTFLGWAGDTSLMQNPASATTNITFNSTDTFVVARAKYKITAAPTGLTTKSLSGGVELKWNAISEAHYKIERATQPNGPYQQIGSIEKGVTSFTDGYAAPNTTYYYRISAFNLDSPAGTTPLSTSVTGTALGIPSPWQTLDIGNPKPGWVAYDSTLYTIAGFGADIWAAPDQFRYLCQPTSGDCSVEARVQNVPFTNIWAKAGVMIRESNTANSCYAAVFVTPTRTINFHYRTKTGINSINTQLDTKISSTIPFPISVKLERTAGNIFTAYYYQNNQWVQLGTPQTISMTQSANAGLAVSSHNVDRICPATFTNVVVKP